jgi:hypothetical protein
VTDDRAASRFEARDGETLAGRLVRHPVDRTQVSGNACRLQCLVAFQNATSGV